ncbi:hypothetical protein ACFQL1_01275 [Halomicroarcula sp. GCM10025709]|uniref:hypothetical protein n=1 Tax=Haloarcula TaxID=2237 RepID=UPI0024C38488|nr:hypothetical protein [Halomicroarcula sp. YJ-61-S]
MTQHGPLLPLLGLLLGVTVGSLVLWVALDARIRDENPLLWGLLAVPLYPVFPVVFFLLRRRAARVDRPDTLFYFARASAVGTVLALAVAGLLSPPDPFSQATYWLVAAPVVVAGLYVYDRRRRQAQTVGGL